MIYEYALEPSLVVDWALSGVGRCVMQFGLDQRRLVSDFPRHWTGQVYADFLQRFGNDYGDPNVTNTQPILDAYLQILTDCMVPRQVSSHVDATWLDAAIQEHAKRPFHAIFAAHPQDEVHPDVITEKCLDDIRDVRWWLPTLKTTRKSAAEIGAALRPILQASSDIYIVDPYFDASKKRFNDTFSAIVRQAVTLPRAVSTTPAITLITGVDREFKAREAPTNAQEELKRHEEERNVAADIRNMVRRYLPPLVPPGVTIQLIILKKAPHGDPLHNRFVLTNVGAVIVPYGIDDYDREEAHSARDDLIPMPRGMYDERWEQYTKIKGVDVVLGPEIISGNAS